MYHRTIIAGSETSRTTTITDNFSCTVLIGLPPDRSWVALANTFLVLTDGLARARRAVGGPISEAEARLAVDAGMLECEPYSI